MYKYTELTEKIINCFYEVHKNLGYGFLEKVYENALIHELELNNMKVESQKSIEVKYKGKVIGNYFADLVVNDTIIIELKASRDLCQEHEAQLINYLKATKYDVGLLLNFGKSAGIKRKIFDKKSV